MWWAGRLADTAEQRPRRCRRGAERTTDGGHPRTPDGQQADDSKMGTERTGADPRTPPMGRIGQVGRVSRAGQLRQECRCAGRGQTEFGEQDCGAWDCGRGAAMVSVLAETVVLVPDSPEPPEPRLQLYHAALYHGCLPPLAVTGAVRPMCGFELEIHSWLCRSDA